MTGILHGLENAGGVEQSGAMDSGHIAAGEELNGNVRVGDMIRELRDDQDLKRIDGEESRVHGATETFDGGTYSGKAIVVIEDASPGGTGVADLVTEVGHDDLFLGGEFPKG